MRLENSFKQQEPREASAKGKKRNQTRRLRRQETRRRIAREAVEAQERLQRKYVKRKKVVIPKGDKTILKGPALIAIEGKGNRRRLPRKANARAHAVRWIQGKRWRIWVQPCWVGICSPRMLLQEQFGKGLASQGIQSG
jgi:hypothetical protein